LGVLFFRRVTENQAGQQFGESRLEQIMRANQSRSVSEFSELLPAEIRAWQPSDVAQQDDITLILVDVLESVKSESRPA
jgi:serine phosphatase RsbU (regulator of sigma subunit)